LKITKNYLKPPEQRFAFSLWEINSPVAYISTHTGRIIKKPKIGIFTKKEQNYKSNHKNKVSQ